MPSLSSLVHAAIAVLVLALAVDGAPSAGRRGLERSHDLKRIVHLRDRLDRVSLQQKTDRLRLQRLQELVDQLLQQQRKTSQEQQLSETQIKSPNSLDKLLHFTRLQREVDSLRYVRYVMCVLYVA